VYPVYRNLGIRIVEKFYDVCDEADVYICDNSSTIFESAAIGKKVILLNSKKYRKDVEHGLRFWSKAGVGVQVDTADTLIDIVGQVLDNKVAIDSSIITTVYNNIGNASKVVVDAILSTPACWGVSEVNDGKITVVANVQFCHTGVLLNIGDEIRVTEREAVRLGRTYKRGVPMASIKPQKQAVVIAGNLEMTAPVEVSAEIIVPSAPAEDVEEKVDDVDNTDSDNAGDDAPAAPKKSSPRKKK
jgi:hypothetical protein